MSCEYVALVAVYVLVVGLSGAVRPLSIASGERGGFSMVKEADDYQQGRGNNIPKTWKTLTHLAGPSFVTYAVCQRWDREGGRAKYISSVNKDGSYKSKTACAPKET